MLKFFNLKYKLSYKESVGFFFIIVFLNVALDFLVRKLMGISFLEPRMIIDKVVDVSLVVLLSLLIINQRRSLQNIKSIGLVILACVVSYFAPVDFGLAVVAYFTTK